MKKYHVTMRVVEYYGADVCANSPEEAVRIAEEIGGDEFEHEDNEDWVPWGVFENGGDE
jgi:hypothetical protein